MCAYDQFNLLIGYCVIYSKCNLFLYAILYEVLSNMLKKLFYLNLDFTKFVRKYYFMFYPNLFNSFNYKLRMYTNSILQFCTVHRILSLF